MQIKNAVKMITLSIVASTMFVGCGGSSDSTPATETTLTGTFIDAPVRGLSYKTPTQSGFTDESGQFKYVPGEEVEFRLGNILLGKGAAEALLTPYSISDNNDTATNIALLLQNFDNDRTDNILNISALQDYNLSDFNISDTNANLESKLTTLLATGEFQTLRGGTAFGLLDSTTVKNAMDSFLADNSVKYDKKFTQAFLDNTVFYKTSDEYPQYKNQYRNGSIYFAGDEENSQGWDTDFTTASSTYVIEDGLLKASFSNGDEVTVKIISITDTSIEVEETHVVYGSRTSTWYITKEAAQQNLISQAMNKTGNVYFLQNGEYIQSSYNGGFTTSNFTLTENGGNLTTLPYSEIEGILKVDWSSFNDSDEYHKIIAVDSQYVYGCIADSLTAAKACSTPTYRINY